MEMSYIKNRILFLGTGGGRHVMHTQIRKTGGIYVELDGKKFIIDPGPGSLINAHALKLSPETWSGVMLSHMHVDHSNDANLMLDGMKDPFLIAEEHCLMNSENYFPYITKYHQSKSLVYPISAGKTVDTGIEVGACKADHYSPTVGFKISGSSIIGYSSDGAYYKGQEKFFEGCDILILNVLVPEGKEIEPHRHMSVDGAISLLKALDKKPKICILTHFSFWMLRAGVAKQTNLIKSATGVNVVPAEDFMEIALPDMAIEILKP